MLGHEGRLRRGWLARTTQTLLYTFAVLLLAIFLKSPAIFAASAVNFSPNSLLNVTSGIPNTITVSLGMPYTSPDSRTPSVTVNLYSSDPSNITLSKTNLPWSGTDNASQSFTVTASVNGTIGYSVTSTDSNFDGQSGSINVTVSGATSSGTGGSSSGGGSTGSTTSTTSSTGSVLGANTHSSSSTDPNNPATATDNSTDDSNAPELQSTGNLSDNSSSDSTPTQKTAATSDAKYVRQKPSILLLGAAIVGFLMLAVPLFIMWKKRDKSKRKRRFLFFKVKPKQAKVPNLVPQTPAFEPVPVEQNYPNPNYNEYRQSDDELTNFRAASTMNTMNTMAQNQPTNPSYPPRRMAPPRIGAGVS